MKDKIFTLIIIGVTILVSGCVTQDTKSINGIETFYHDVYLSISGSPYLNNSVNLTLTAATSEAFGRGNTTLTIALPEGFELISGNLTQNVTLDINEIYNHTIIIKANKTGNWEILGWAGPYWYPKYDGDVLYVNVEENDATVSEIPPICEGNIFEVMECMRTGTVKR